MFDFSKEFLQHEGISYKLMTYMLTVNSLAKKRRRIEVASNFLKVDIYMKIVRWFCNGEKQ